MRDYSERVVYTFLSAFAASVSASTMFNISVLRSAAIAGLAAGVNLVSLPLRNDLPFLPDVGTGLPPAKK